MRGASIGSVYVAEAYNATRTITLDSSTNNGLFNSLIEYFSSGNETLIIYAPSTRGTYPGGYCYDYLSITAVSLEFSFQYLESAGSMATTSVAAGSTAKINITTHNGDYSHKVIWKFGSYSHSQSIAAGVSSASYTIPLTWRNAIPSATSGAATATLETYNASGA